MHAYTFAYGNLEPPFGLYQMYPHREISVQNAPFDLESGCSLVVEQGNVDFDPELLFSDEQDITCKGWLATNGSVYKTLILSYYHLSFRSLECTRKILRILQKVQIQLHNYCRQF